jgi:hypothetical protein
MSIAFIPITEDNPLYNEKLIKDKWENFLAQFSSSFFEEFDVEIEQNEFNSIVEGCLNKIYLSSSSNKNEVEKKEEKKKEEKKVEKKKEERLRCVQILRNNEQCKGKQVNGGQYCTRHTPKKEELSSSESEDN